MGPAGVRTGIPSTNITIRNVSSNGARNASQFGVRLRLADPGVSLGIAGIAIGSEMSGGVSDVVIEDLVGTGEMGIDVKSGKGRGGYIRNGTRTPPARPRPLGCSC